MSDQFEIKTIATYMPKFGDPSHMIGKPVTDEYNNRIGTIVDVKDDGDYYKIIMNVKKPIINNMSRIESFSILSIGGKR